MIHPKLYGLAFDNLYNVGVRVQEHTSDFSKSWTSCHLSLTSKRLWLTTDRAIAESVLYGRLSVVVYELASPGQQT